MEKHNPPPRHSNIMKNKPPLRPEATHGCRQKHKKMKTTESGTSGTTSGPPSGIDPSKSFVPLSSNLNITSTLSIESDTIKTEVPETLLHEVIEPNFPKLDNLLPKVVEPNESHPYPPITSGPSPSLPLSHT